MSFTVENLGRGIRHAKRLLTAQTGDVAAALASMQRAIEPAIERVVGKGSAAIPDIDFADIRAGKLSQSDKDHIRASGCAIVRGVFSCQQAEDWDNQISNYIATNRYLEKTASRAGLDKYFDLLASGKPQIFGLYWSKPQMQARQSPELAELRSWLNSLWYINNQEFDPNRECLYADRVRRRDPGDATLGLSPHVDGGSVERWLGLHYRKVYAKVFSANPQQYQPFDAAWRTTTEEIPSPAVCSMFRTYQGWTALTGQGQGDGTLQLVPISQAMGWILLRALQKDVDEEDVCGAQPGRALQVSADYHALLLHAYVPIPRVEPGDTVWWHPDLIHGVEGEHTGDTSSNVIYIGAAPYCAKNRAFLDKQRGCFEQGKSSPDFAPEDYEVDFVDRFLPAELSELGRVQMGY